jgi:large subunit ribosomal protein L19
MSALLEELQKEGMRSDLPEFRSGDTVTVKYKIREGEKERIQAFKGVVIQCANAGVSQSFTVRKMSGTTSVERVFPLHTPLIASIDVERKGAVRQARIFYMRDLQGKAARIKERK